MSGGAIILPEAGLVPLTLGIVYLVAFYVTADAGDVMPEARPAAPLGWVYPSAFTQVASAVRADFDVGEQSERILPLGASGLAEIDAIRATILEEAPTSALDRVLVARGRYRGSPEGCPRVRNLSLAGHMMPGQLVYLAAVQDPSAEPPFDSRPSSPAIPIPPAPPNPDVPAPPPTRPDLPRPAPWTPTPVSGDVPGGGDAFAIVAALGALAAIIYAEGRGRKKAFA